MKDRILRLLKKKQMTTDELCWDLRTARSTLMVAITRMRAEGIVCIAAWRYTGSSPAKLWGLGSVDAPRPAVQTKEERYEKRNALRRKVEQEERIYLSKKSTARRDVAASWF